MGSILKVPREEGTNAFLGQYANQGLRAQAHKPKESAYLYLLEGPTSKLSVNVGISLLKPLRHHIQ